MALVTLALQIYSILAATLAAGANLGTSVITFPALLHADTQTLNKQWKILYDSGITPVVTLAMSGSAGFAALAYRSTPTSTLMSAGLVSHARRNAYIAAAVMAFSLGPYTRLLMGSTIDELVRRAQSGKDEKGDTRELVGNAQFLEGNDAFDRCRAGHLGYYHVKSFISIRSRTCPNGRFLSADA